MIKALKAEQKFFEQRSEGEPGGKCSPNKGMEHRPHVRQLGNYFTEARDRAAGFCRSPHLKGLKYSAKESGSCFGS